MAGALDNPEKEKMTSVEYIRQQVTGKARNYIGNDASLADSESLTKLDSVRLDSLLSKINIIVNESVPGAIVETGVWRGGSAILMQAALLEHKDTRPVWLCDTFSGFPPGSEPHSTGALAVSRQAIEQNIKAVLGRIPPNLRLVEGAFADTLPKMLWPYGIALLHFDADSPMAIIEVLNTLYGAVVPGGFVIIDDFCLLACRQALYKWLSKCSLAPSLMNPYTKQELRAGEIPCGLWWRK